MAKAAQKAEDIKDEMYKTLEKVESSKGLYNFHDSNIDD